LRTWTLFLSATVFAFCFSVVITLPRFCDTAWRVLGHELPGWVIQVCLDGEWRRAIYRANTNHAASLEIQG
jgi:hypothetical protein